MRLALRESGVPTGPPVVFLHAFPLASGMWEPQREAMKSFRVLAPDMRGFGKTPLVAPFLIEHMVDDVLETLDGLGVPQAVFVGNSMGGYVALRLAEKAPQRVRALVLCDSRAEADGNEARLKRAAAIESVRAGGMAAFAEPFLKGALAPQTWTRSPMAADFLRQLIVKASPEAVMNALAALAARTETLPALSDFRFPALILVGSDDRLTPLACSETMRGRIAGSELRVVPDAGHFPSVENPAVFNDRLLTFLKRL
ncbi:MAG: hypothetical protein A2V88_05135 [Elusimicrobia bacterium RBG_16_66_12]|nr:MAG: hypothetical protein A2V88_05135 [Elusimicrobia bacterium RBG_16_66_12]